MTTEFQTKEEAILAGIYYAGMQEKLDPADLSWQGSEVSQLGIIHPIETTDFANPNGKIVRIGIGTFRAGFELWLIDPTTGLACRV
jgi:hypothetical protein